MVGKRSLAAKATMEARAVMVTGSSSVISASDRCRLSAANALAKSLGPCTSRDWRAMPNAGAARWTSRQSRTLAGDARHAGKRFLEHLEPFRAQLGQHLGHAGDVAAGFGQAGHVARADRIAVSGEHDWNGYGRLPGCSRLRCGHREDDVHVQAHKFGSKIG